MDCRDFTIILVGANNLERVRKKHKMEVYAVVSMANDPKTKKPVPAEKHGDTNPDWKKGVIKYTVGEIAVQQHGFMLVIKLYTHISLGKDRYIGEVYVPLKELFDKFSLGQADASYPVQIGSKISQGVLEFRYQFGERYSKKKPPVWKKMVSTGLVLARRGTYALGVPLAFKVPVRFDVPVFV